MKRCHHLQVREKVYQNEVGIVNFLIYHRQFRTFACRRENDKGNTSISAFQARGFLKTRITKTRSTHRKYTRNSVHRFTTRILRGSQTHVFLISYLGLGLALQSSLISPRLEGFQFLQSFLESRFFFLKNWFVFPLVNVCVHVHACVSVTRLYPCKISSL